MSSPIVHARNSVGRAVRRGDRDGERIARQNLAAAKVAAVIEREATVLRPEQRDALVVLLRGGAA